MSIYTSSDSVKKHLGGDNRNSFPYNPTYCIAENYGRQVFNCEKACCFLLTIYAFKYYNDYPERIIYKKMNLKEFIDSTKGKAYKLRILEWFKLNLGKPVTSQQLAQIPGRDGNPISHNIRRVFELRDEGGYEIVNWRDNKTTGLNLRVNEWVLFNPNPDPDKIRARGVNKKIMFEVFSRDSYQCQFCGRISKDDDPFKKGHKIKLHIGHIIAHKRKDGKDIVIVEKLEDMNVNHKLTKDDFITMCNVCNEGAKNTNIKPITLVDRVKSADPKIKREILRLLRKELD